MSNILTSGGRLIDPFDLTVEDIDVVEIAHSLSMLNRYTGHTRAPYSVAEHSVLLSETVPVYLARAAIVHDMGESFTNDIPNPFKQRLPDYCAFEEQVHRVICDAFGVPWVQMMELRPYDRRMCQDEMLQAFDPPHDLGLDPLGVVLHFWPWHEAKRRFLHRFWELFHG